MARVDETIDVVMLAGMLLLQSGSEVHRVEDTMLRIARSQGFSDCHALAMPAAIIFSIDGTQQTRMKRITRFSYNIEKVCDVNQISRQLTAGQVSLNEAYHQLEQLKVKPFPYTTHQRLLAATCCAPFFTLIFGGSLVDALGAAGTVFIAFALFLQAEAWVGIPFVSAFAGAFVFTALAQLGANMQLPLSVDLVTAGAVMPFVPGIALTNAVRDLMNNHINTGMSRLFESLLVTLGLGAGTSVALLVMRMF